MSAEHNLTTGRVSLIVPCFNVERYFADFLQSIMAQTYKNLEVILVNDGANEATTGLLRDAVEPLEAEGYLVKLIEQENKGLGGAVDTGLKLFTGEFLMWPDPDDWLVPHSVARRVELMHENPDVGLLRTNAKLFIEARQEYDGHFMPPEASGHMASELFENLLFLRVFFAPVCHMVRSDMFLEVHPDRSIFFKPESSQNFQLLVPVVERFPVLELPGEVLACYRVREDSRSRAPNTTREKLLGRFEQLMELTEETMPKLQTATPERLRRMRNFHWRHRMLPTAFRACMRERCIELVELSALGVWQKALVLRMIDLQCWDAFRSFDLITGRLASRLLARTFDRAVRMPKTEMTWGAGPLWA